MVIITGIGERALKPLFSAYCLVSLTQVKFSKTSFRNEFLKMLKFFTVSVKSPSATVEKKSETYFKEYFLCSEPLTCGVLIIIMFKTHVGNTANSGPALAQPRGRGVYLQGLGTW